MLAKSLIKIKNFFWKTEPRGFLLRMMPKHSICAEIGVWRGNFSEKILRVIKPKKLHLIDLWLYQESAGYRSAMYGGKSGSQAVLNEIYQSVTRKFSREVASGQVTIHRKLSAEAAREFPDNYFDWIYIDGDHQYEFVKKDLEFFYPKVKPGGFITGDDYEDRGWWQGGVKRAVDEFIASGRAQKIKIKKNQFVLRKRSVF